MKLIRIGSSPTSDIQLTSSYVSSTHAEITLLDGGEIILEDLGSTNGTFVGDKKIKANQEVTIRRGDRIRFADTELVWARIPSLQNNSSFAKIVNIGTNYRNDLQINSGAVSRFHATIKVDKKGKAFIVDNGSRNGTKVNGIKVAKETPTAIKRGDNIILANEDITESIQQFLPKKNNALKIILSSLAAVAVLAGLVFGVIHSNIFGTSPDEKAIVHVYAGYHYEITLEGLPVQFSSLKLRYPSEGELHNYQGSAFFIDRLGRLATNRHITRPWEYRSEEESYLIKKETEKWIYDLFGGDFIDTETKMRRFINTPHGKEIYNYIQERYPADQYLLQLNVLIQTIRRANIKVNGILGDIRIGYSGRMYNDFMEYVPCTVIAESKDTNVDLSIIQLNNMKTPEQITKILDINNISVEKLEPMEKVLCTTGYPNGLNKGFATTQTLQPTTYETKCSKRPDKYIFECQASSERGASGSPVYIKGTCKLVGVLSGGYNTNEGGIICVQAQYLKELYDKECK